MSAHSVEPIPVALIMIDDRLSTLRQHGERFKRKIDNAEVITVHTSDPSVDVVGQRLAHSGPAFCLVDLRQPDATGQESEEVGLRQIAQLARLPDTIVVSFSAYDDEITRQKAQDAGAAESWKKDLQIKDLDQKVRAYIDRLAAGLPPRPVGMGVPEPIDPVWERQLREEKEWLSSPENLEQYAGQVVALFEGKVWGQGTTQLSTLEAVRIEVARHAGEPGVPAPHELMYLVIPDWKSPAC